MEKYVNEFEVGDGIIADGQRGKVTEIHHHGNVTKLFMKLDHPAKTNYKRWEEWHRGIDGATKFGYFEWHDAKRNCFGQLEYRIGDYFVTKHESCEKKYKIKKQEFPWLVDDAVVGCELIGLWDEPEFDSFIQAAIFLKKHVDEML